MLQTALQNLVITEEAEALGTGWKITLNNDNILFVDCGDEGFTYKVYYAAEDQTWSEEEVLETVTELKELIAC